MDKKHDGPDAGRRGFLKLASVSAPAAVAALTVSGQEAEAATPGDDSSAMRDTAHTRAYFDSARF